MLKTIRLSGLCGTEVQENDCIRFERCPFCGELDCFCVYRDHAYCHSEEKRYTKEQVLTWLHKKTPCSITLSYPDDLPEMPAQLRCKQREFILPDFGYPVFGYTADNEPYVLCWNRDKQLQRIVWARPHRDWLTLLGSSRMEFSDKPKFIVICRNLSQAIRLEKVAYEAWNEQSRQILFTALPPEQDAELFCVLPDLSGCTVYLADILKPSQIFVNRLYQAGVNGVYKDTGGETPYVWDAGYIHKMLNWGDVELLKQDKRVSEQRAVQNMTKQNFVTEFVRNFGAKTMTVGGEQYILLAPNDYNISSELIDSRVLSEVVAREMINAGIKLTEKKIKNTILEIQSASSKVSQVTHDIGGRLLFYDKKIYINASPTDVITVSKTSIDIISQNSEKGIYFTETPTGNFDFEDSGDETVRDILAKMFGEQWDKLINPIIGAYISILPFLSKEPHPILLFEAPEGRGKTFAACMMRHIISPIRDFFETTFITNKPIDLMFAVSNRCVSIIDNLYNVNQTFASVLCQASTSCSSDFRVLMTNKQKDKSVINGLIILTGVSTNVSHSDFISRLLIINFPKLCEYKSYDMVSFMVPKLRHAILKVMQKLIEYNEHIGHDYMSNRFVVFSKLFAQALEYCGWDKSTYIDFVKNQKSEAVNTLLTGNKILDCLMNDIQIGKKYKSHDLYNIIIDRTRMDATRKSVMRQVCNLEQTLEKAGLRLIRGTTNGSSTYKLERIE